MVFTWVSSCWIQKWFSRFYFGRHNYFFCADITAGLSIKRFVTQHGRRGFYLFMQGSCGIDLIIPVTKPGYGLHFCLNPFLSEACFLR